MQPQWNDLAECPVQDCRTRDTKLHLTKAGEAETNKSKGAAEKFQSLLLLPRKTMNALSGPCEKKRIIGEPELEKDLHFIKSLPVLAR